MQICGAGGSCICPLPLRNPVTFYKIGFIPNIDTARLFVYTNLVREPGGTAGIRFHRKLYKL